MIKVIDRETGSSLGSLTEDQLDFLIENLEEESTRDQDYYIDKDVIEMLAGKGIDADLKEFLERALGGRKSAEIVWEDA
jgi:processive 1,2-diacylglycerol beta-glucosyltransferase